MFGGTPKTSWCPSTTLPTAGYYWKHLRASRTSFKSSWMVKVCSRVSYICKTNRITGSHFFVFIHVKSDDFICVFLLIQRRNKVNSFILLKTISNGQLLHVILPVGYAQRNFFCEIQETALTNPLLFSLALASMFFCSTAYMGSWFDHVREYYAARDQLDIHFVQYENMLKVWSLHVK